MARLARRRPGAVGVPGLSVDGERRRVAVRVTGAVQGVGFRPFAYRLAESAGVAGFVRNDADAVTIEAEGSAAAVDELLRRLAEAPAPARVETVDARRIAAIGEEGFRIVASRAAGGAGAPVPPDVATCDECLAEMRDTADRRHRYPFVNCASCGPRFTIVRSLPYDRANTTMSRFPMCAACRREYEDPADRRFHAEANACPECGPQAAFLDPGGAPLPLGPHPDAVAAAGALLAGGGIVAIKGLGGWHLACRADHDAAVAALRRRKHRDTKPFAIVVADLGATWELVRRSLHVERLLLGPERPIVLAPRLPAAAVSELVAPGCSDLGVMLPHTALHHLLIAGAGGPLVMTSGNVASEPIAYEDGDAFERLGAIADAFLLNDRPIETPAEDSVIRVTGVSPLMIRRSRGYVPAAIPLRPAAARPVLGAGADLKSCVCLGDGEHAWPGPQAGDLAGLGSRRRFEADIAHLQHLCRIEAEVVAHDLHPDYASTRWALETGAELVPVQHHHAHLAACLSEHSHAGPVAAAIFDGAGLGLDGSVWGGEILVGDAASFERVGGLLAVPLPGGDAAAREPWRMACSWLRAAGGGDVPAMPAALAPSVRAQDWEAVARIAAGPATVMCSSAGRLFDAVAALAGFGGRSGHEGQAAMELEAAADPFDRGAYEIAVSETGADDRAEGREGRFLLLDPRPAVTEIFRDVDGGLARSVVAARFHNGLAAAIAAAVARAAAGAGVESAVLAGGVLQNRLLLERTAARLNGQGLRVLVPVRLPPNDGAIAYGQVAVAAAGLGA